MHGATARAIRERTTPADPPPVEAFLHIPDLSRKLLVASRPPLSHKASPSCHSAQIRRVAACCNTPHAERARAVKCGGGQGTTQTAERRAPLGPWGHRISTKGGGPKTTPWLSTGIANRFHYPKCCRWNDPCWRNDGTLWNSNSQHARPHRRRYSRNAVRIWIHSSPYSVIPA